MLDSKVQAAKALLKESDIDRIICIYLSSQNATIDWESAKQLFGTTGTSTPMFKWRCKKALEAFETACKRNTNDCSISTPPDSPTAENDKKRKASSPTEETVEAEPKAKRGGGRKGLKGEARSKNEDDVPDLGREGLLD